MLWVSASFWVANFNLTVARNTIFLRVTVHLDKFKYKGRLKVRLLPVNALTKDRYGQQQTP
jgi:hypothetical protein